MPTKAIKVRVFAAPDASCGHGMPWSTASALVGKRLNRRFGNGYGTEHIEIFSPRSFEFPEIMAHIEAGARLPIVMVGDRVVSRGGKISERIIGLAVEALLADKEAT